MELGSHSHMESWTVFLLHLFSASGSVDRRLCGHCSPQLPKEQVAEYRSCSALAVSIPTTLINICCSGGGWFGFAGRSI